MINPLSAQSPWLQQKQTLLTQLSLNVIPNYDQLFINSGEKYNTERILSDYTMQGWFEYGVSEHMALQLILPVKFLNAGDLIASETATAQTSSGSIKAFGNIAIIWKQKLLQQAWILTSHLIMELPTASYQDESGLRSGYDASAISGALSTGRGFGRGYFYAHLGIGVRSNKYSGFATGGLEGGYQLSEIFWVAGVVNILQSFMNGTRQDPVNNLRTGLYVNDQEFFAWGLKLFGSIIPEKFGYSLAVFSAASGNFVAKSAPFNFGLYYVFSL
jgi:hypothetical protein